MFRNKILGVCVAIAMLCVANNAEAQRWFRTSSLEFGLIGGFSHYSGELTNEQFFEAQGLKGSVGLITRYTPHESVTFRLSAQYGSLEGDDKWHEDQTDPMRRDLNFTSSLWDFTGAAEFNFKRIPARQKSGVSPYAFIGASVFRFNPKSVFVYDPNSGIANYQGITYSSLEDRDGEEVELQPLATEGQETTQNNELERYSLTQVAVPVGLGIKFKVNHQFTIGVEYGPRITFTDYLDDVSGAYVEPTQLQAQYGTMSAAMAYKTPTVDANEILDVDNPKLRGNPDNNDLYGIFGVTLTYRLYGNRAICPTF